MEEANYTITGEPVRFLGSPYLLIEEEKGIFKVVRSVLPTSDHLGVCEYDESIEDLVLGQDIVEVRTKTNHAVIEGPGEDMTIRFCDAARSLGRTKGMLYVGFRSIDGGFVVPYNDPFDDEPKFLARLRFFQRKYDTGIDPHVQV